MKRLFIISSILFIACTNSDQNKASLTKLATSSSISRICVQVYCRDSVWLPVNSMPLVAYITSTDSIVSRGWSQLSGPSSIPIKGSIDSVGITGLIAGQYVFAYSAANSKGVSGSGRDTVTVVPLTMVSGVITYPDGSAQAIKPFKTLTINYSNGSSKTITP